MISDNCQDPGLPDLSSNTTSSLTISILSINSIHQPSVSQVFPSKSSAADFFGFKENLINSGVGRPLFTTIEYPDLKMIFRLDEK